MNHKKECFNHWGRQCTLCKNYADDPHHFFPVGRYPELKDDIKNLVPLCRKHHNEIHSDKRKDLERQIVRRRGHLWITELKKKIKN